MPNFVANTLAFDGDPERIKDMLAAIQNDAYGLGTISFDKIIPMPPELNIAAGSKSREGLQLYTEFMKMYSMSQSLTKEDMLNVPEEIEEDYFQVRPGIDRETWELGKKSFRNLQKYGAPDWYDWRIQNWDTKWDAGGYEENVDYSKCDKLAFTTAWSEPAQVIQKLSEMYPNIEITHQWSEEQLTVSCGRAVYLAGEQIEYEPRQDTPGAEEFSLEVWHQLDINERRMEQGQTMQ